MTSAAGILTLAEKPVPLYTPDPTSPSYRRFPVDLTRPESSEPLVRADEYGLAGESYYAREDGLNVPYYYRLPGAPEYVWVRVGIARRLQRVNEALKPAGLELYLWDGYRTVECQKGIYDWMFDRAMRILPDADVQKAMQYISPYISDPTGLKRDDPSTWISHITGGAVDLTLRRVATGELLHMGGVFDDPDEVSSTDWFEQPANTPRNSTDEEARRNRRILLHVMLAEGFSNLPSEWWHYDYGDQLWAKNRPRLVPEEKNLVAWYGPADLPDDYR